MELKRRRAQQSHKCFQDDENNSDESDEYFQNKRSKVLLTLEDKTTKSKRLQDEGVILAESERYWEAIKYWNEAIELTPENPVLHEIKAQVRLFRASANVPFLQAWM
jgi:tetratricopeptide (TPR) repeat protein